MDFSGRVSDFLGGFPDFSGVMSFAVGFGGRGREGGGGGTAADAADDAAASSDRMELMEARESMECSLHHDSLNAFLTAGLLRYVLTAGSP